MTMISVGCRVRAEAFVTSYHSTQLLSILIELSLSNILAELKR